MRLFSFSELIALATKVFLIVALMLCTPMLMRSAHDLPSFQRTV